VRQSRRRSWAPLLLLVLLLAGCWDRREIEEKSTVLMVGVDLCAQGEGCNVMLSRQIAIPGRIPLGSAGGAGAGGGGSGDTVFVVHSPGKHYSDTTSDAQAQVNRSLHFGHLKLLVWSEEFARQGVADWAGFTRRNAEYRRNSWIAVTEGRAEDVIRSRPTLNRVPALFFNDMFDDAIKGGRIPKIYWGEFLNRLSNKGEDAIAPLIRMDGRDKPMLSGLAVFRGGRMVGKLTPEEMATYMEVQGVKRGAELLMIDLPGGGRVDLRVDGRRTHYRLRSVGGRIYASVDIVLESQLIMASDDVDITDRHVRELIANQAAAEVKLRANALVEKLQKGLRVDVISLGERVRAYLPATWKSIPDWPTAFADAQYDFEVKVNLRRAGMGFR
jgi:spore germination protein KC